MNEPSPLHAELNDVEGLKRLVEKYDLRWAADPTLLYPPEQMGAFGPGWLPLVERLIRTLIDFGWNRHVGQMNRAFGVLNFLIPEGVPGYHALIEEAELESFTLCDVCGAPGRMSDRMPSKVRCSEHSNV